MIHAKGWKLTLLLSAACLFTAHGQEFRATLNGRVTDPTGAGVAGAKVTATSASTNETASADTSGTGDYNIPLLKPGNYSVRVEASGFKSAVRDNIELFVGDKKTADISLEVGAMQETLTITAAPPMLEETTATRGAVIENLRVEELPISGRNPFNLANLSPGVTFAGNPQFTRPFDNGDNARFAINGGVRQSNEFIIDGTPDNAATDTQGNRTRSDQNIAYVPTVDSTQEFRIVTNFYDAQYGRTRRRYHQRLHQVGNKRFSRNAVRVYASLSVGRQQHRRECSWTSHLCSRSGNRTKPWR